MYKMTLLVSSSLETPLLSDMERTKRWAALRMLEPSRITWRLKKSEVFTGYFAYFCKLSFFQFPFLKISLSRQALAIVIILFIINSCVFSSAFAQEVPKVIKELSRIANISEEQAEKNVINVFAAIESELKAGRSVTVRKFGRFYIAEARKKHDKGLNKEEGSKKRYPRFASSDSLRRAVNIKY